MATEPRCNQCGTITGSAACCWPVGAPAPPPDTVSDDNEPAHVESMLRRAGAEVHPGGFGYCIASFNGKYVRGQCQFTLTMTKGQARILLAALGLDLPTTRKEHNHE